MTNRERLISAISHEEADKVPYDLAGTTVTGISGVAWQKAMALKDLPQDYEESKTIDHIAQTIMPPENMLKYLKVDTRRIGARRSPEIDKRLRRNGNELIFTDQFGCSWKMREGKDFYFNQIYHPLEKYDDIKDAVKNLELPDLSLRKQELYKLFDSQLPTEGDYGLVADRNTAGLIEMYLRFRGYENGYMDMALHTAEFCEIIDRIAEHKIQYWDIFGDYIKERGLENSFLVAAECDDLGTQQSLLVSHQMLKDYIFPVMKKYIGFIRKKLPGVKIFFHSCGAVKPLIPEFIEIGIDILNPVQYTASGMGLLELKKDFGKDIVFWGGGIDTQGILSSGSVQQVRDEVKKNIDIMAPGGGYIFTPVHNVQEDVPAENFWAMWEAWDEFGKR